MEPPLAPNPEQLANELASKWRWVMGLGLVLLLGGGIGIAAPYFTSKAVVTAIGLLFLLGGIANVASALQMSGARAVGPTAVTGILMTVCGGLFVFQTDAGVNTVTLILAIFFLVQGVLKVMGAFYVRPDPVWTILLFDGGVTSLLGGLVLGGWPDKSFAAIGLLVGISLLFSGASVLSVAFSLKRLDAAR